MYAVFENERYIIFRLKPEDFLISTDNLYSELILEAERTSASMVYSDYFLLRTDGTRVPNPLIDCLPGSLRDDFDFGAFVCVRKSDYQAWKDLEQSEGRREDSYRYGAFYALRLFLSVQSGITRVPRQLYGIREYDPRLSGEKQFDYVDRKNREVQTEMEQIFTRHLRRNGFYLPQRTRRLETDDTVFPVEATVVIPVLNRIATVKDAVESALSQITDFEYNILVVDNYSTDGTYEVLSGMAEQENRLRVIRPQRKGLGIGGCWNLAVFHPECGRYAVQLDSDDLYSGTDTLQKIVSKFREDGSAMVIGSYRMTDFDLRPLPPGVIDHREWTDGNGHNNALRINGLGAPRAFATSLLRRIGGFPNVSYGEDYAVGLRITREYRLSRIYDVLYNCRRWGGNSDANLDVEKINRNNRYKDSVRSAELAERMLLAQREAWPEAARRYAALSRTVVKPLVTGDAGVKIVAQYNPERAVSTLAATDSRSIAERPCFLCRTNRPAVQKGAGFNRDGRRYEILFNPYPILPSHFTIPSLDHEPQHITPERFEDLLTLAEIFQRNVLFYNGPRCGASAPDHLHFQMGSRGFIPLERDYGSMSRIQIGARRGTRVLMPDRYLKTAVIFDSDSIPDSVQCFSELYSLLAAMFPIPGETEPRMNILSWYQEGRYITIVIPRTAHRPECYAADADHRVRVSPASVDLGGVYVVPVREDFDRLDAGLLETIVSQVTPLDRLEELKRRLSACFNRPQKEITVGLMTETKVSVIFNGGYAATAGPVSTKSVGKADGTEHFQATDGKISWKGNLYGELFFQPEDGVSATFMLKGVTIGVNFHWQRKENQLFRGALKLIVSEGRIVVINVVGVEDYLYSVISSEMSGKGSPEFLKAHAVISRSWLLARPTISGGDVRVQRPVSGPQGNDERYIRWYDRDDHTLFDVCADDHCQRYQGLVRSTDRNIAAAIDETWGEVLKYRGEICDARFSKCCGGISERFDVCWEDRNPDYLTPVRDVPGAVTEAVRLPDFSDEKMAREWILDRPESFCSTNDPALLGKVLNSYDVETTDFYRWKVEYSRQELSDLIRRKSGIDFGEIRALNPLRRGASGRLYELEIVGTERRLTVGKELEIRRILSETHLYSSAFVVDTEGEGTLPDRFILRGAGWGHGVGLCQIGAAAMGERGYRYSEILLHYFRGASLERGY